MAEFWEKPDFVQWDWSKVRLYSTQEVLSDP